MTEALPTPGARETSTTPATPSTPAASADALRCIQRLTGEWFSFASGNPPGKETPDAADLCTEAEARTRLSDLGHRPDEVDERISTARAHAEVTTDSPHWNAAPPGTLA